MDYVELISGIDVVTCIVPKNFNRAVLERLCRELACDGSNEPRVVCRRLGKRCGIAVCRDVEGGRAYHSAWYGSMPELMEVAIEVGAELEAV